MDTRSLKFHWQWVIQLVSILIFQQTIYLDMMTLFCSQPFSPCWFARSLKESILKIHVS